MNLLYLLLFHSYYHARFPCFFNYIYPILHIYTPISSSHFIRPAN